MSVLLVNQLELIIVKFALLMMKLKGVKFVKLDTIWITIKNAIKISIKLF